MAKEVKRTTRNITPRATGTAVATPVRTTPAPATGRAPTVVTEQQIRERAYQIYLARNGRPGDPAADWAQAERELRGPAFKH
jgi:hypothetical protein